MTATTRLMAATIAVVAALAVPAEMRIRPSVMPTTETRHADAAIGRVNRDAGEFAPQALAPVTPADLHGPLVSLRRNGLLKVIAPLLWERGAGGESGQAQPQPPSPPDSPDAQIAAARKIFDSLDYERALIELDKVVALLEPRRSQAGSREQLATALELRARTHFGLGATGRAREDFLTLIALLPDYQLDDTVSPRVAALFKDVRSLLVGQIALSIDPGDAQVVVDGRPVDSPSDPIDVVSGEHTLTVTRSGYKPATVNVSVEPGRATEWRVTLERAAATLSLELQPGDVEVLVNGTSRGRTADTATPFV